MRWLHRATGTPASVGLLAGSFNPPTVAHMELAAAALQHVDEVVLALPQALPHKPFDGATLEQRAAMLCRITESHAHLSAAVAETGGLVVDIVRECRPCYPEAAFWFVCGRDAAQRIMEWDYQGAHTIDSLLEEFGLLVAPRKGRYEPPERCRHRFLEIASGDWEDVSSTLVRDAIARGQAWSHLVPPGIAQIVGQIYRG